MVMYRLWVTGKNVSACFLQTGDMHVHVEATLNTTNNTRRKVAVRLPRSSPPKKNTTTLLLCFDNRVTSRGLQSSSPLSVIVFKLNFNLSVRLQRVEKIKNLISLLHTTHTHILDCAYCKKVQRGKIYISGSSGSR